MARPAGVVPIGAVDSVRLAGPGEVDRADLVRRIGSASTSVVAGLTVAEVSEMDIVESLVVPRRHRLAGRLLLLVRPLLPHPLAARTWNGDWNP